MSQQTEVSNSETVQNIPEDYHAFMLPIDPNSDLKKFMLAGYASVHIVDTEGQRVALEALDDAFKKMMSRESRRNYMYHHQNVQIGELHWNYTDGDGNPWQAGIDYDGTLNAESLKKYGRTPKPGLFVLTEVYQDKEASKIVLKEMQAGNLLSYSIGGRVLKGGHKTVCDDTSCWDEVIKIELDEITSCNTGINTSAEAFILKDKEADTEPISTLSEPNENVYKEPPASTSGGEQKMDDDILKKTLDGIQTSILKLQEDSIEKASKVKYFFGKPRRDDFQKDNDYHAVLGAYHALLETTMTDIENTSIDIEDKDTYRTFMLQRVKDGETVELAKQSWLKAKPVIEPPVADKIIEKDGETDTPDPADKITKEHIYAEPLKEDFKKDEDYTAEKAKYDTFVETIRKQLTEAEGGEIIKKGQIPPKDSDDTMTFDKVLKQMDEAESLITFIQ